MTPVREKTKKGGGRRHYLLPLLLLLLAIPVLVAVSGELRRETGTIVGQNTVSVNDGVRTVSIVPLSDVPVSGLTAEDFRTDGDMVSYRGSARQGIDVSEHQGQIDWEQVAGSGIAFVYLRLGYRGTTEGQIHLDERFAENLEGARAAGLDVGVYFFSQALDQREANEEADFVAQTLGGQKLDLPVMFDWEPVKREGSRTEGLEAQVVTTCAEAFCRRITLSGYGAGVYFNRQQGYYSYDLSQLKDFAFWVSDPNPWPDFYYRFDMWQYSFTGHVPGINTSVDRNLLFEKGGAEG